MQTKTKIPLEPAEIDAIMAQTFATPVLSVEELADGMFNAAYRVALKDHAPVFIKVSPPPAVPVMTYEQELIQTEAQSYELVQKAAAVPVPELLAVDCSRTLIERDYLITTFLRGTPWNKLPKKTRKQHIDSLRRDLGRALGAQHKIEGPGFGYFKDLNQSAAQAWDSAFLGMVEQALQDGEAMKVKLPFAYARIREIFAANRRFLQDVDSPRLVHFDVWANNVFVRPTENGYALEGLVDYERAFWGDPLADFVSNFALFPNVETQPIFLEGYRASFGTALVFNESARRRLKLYRAYLFLLMLIEMPYRAYPWRHRIIRPLLVWELRKLLTKL